MRASRSRHCPKCASERIHRSRRRGLLEHLLSLAGGEIRRCHDCRARRCWFGSARLTLPESDTPGRGAGIVVLCSGFIFCLALVWWMITRTPAT